MLNETLRDCVRRPLFWEICAAVGVALGLIMLMQPYSKWAYQHGFIVLLIATAAYVVLSHFPDRKR